MTKHLGGNPEGPEGHWEPDSFARTGSPRRFACPNTSSRLLHLPFFLLLPLSNHVFLANTPTPHPSTPPFSYGPFWRHLLPTLYTFLPAHAVPVPALCCLYQRSPDPAILV